MLRLSPPSGSRGTFAFSDGTKNTIRDTLRIVKSVTEIVAEPAGISDIPSLNEGLTGIAKMLQKILVHIRYLIVLANTYALLQDLKASAEGVGYVRQGANSVRCAC